MATDADPMPIALRQDARRNRRRILDVAKEVFAEQGLDAPLVEITRRAGVGDGTLYRRFPTRADLYAALRDDARETIEEFHQEAMCAPDGWTALATLFERACEFTIANRAVGELLAIENCSSAAREEQHEQAFKVVGVLVERAHREGSLHPGVTPGDVHTALTALMVMIPASASVAPCAWRRQMAFTLNGFRPDDSLALPAVAPVDTAQHGEILDRLFHQRC